MAVSVAELMTISVLQGGGRRHSVWSGIIHATPAGGGIATSGIRGKPNTFRKVVKNNNRSAVNVLSVTTFPEKWSSVPSRRPSAAARGHTDRNHGRLIRH